MTADEHGLAELLASYKNALAAVKASRAALEAAVVDAARVRVVCLDRLRRAGQEDDELVVLLGPEVPR